MSKINKSSHKTLNAVKSFNRRTLLKRGAALTAFASVAPLYVKNAFAATSGQVNVLMWGEYLPDSVVADFKAKTGITINHTKIGDNGEIIAKMKAGGGAGYDLASPTNMRALQWENLGVLAPFDMNKISNIGNVNPGMVAVGDRDWNFGGKGSHWVPQLWGTESISWRTDKWTPDGLPSFGDLWEPNPGISGAFMMGRTYSMMKAGEPVAYQTTDEGALAWVDGITLSAKAENIDEAYELVNYSFTPEVGGKTINEIGYNSAVIGASDYYSDATKAISQAVYPGDTASKLNPWPPEPPWFADARAEYANKFETA